MTDPLPHQAAARTVVTAALPYANGHLHVGHIGGAYLPADTYVRYLRLCGHETAFICGADCNGVPITLAARQEGTTPQAIVDKYHAAQQTDFAGLGIDFDIYGQTTTPRHHALAAEFFLKNLEHGHLKKRQIKQLYDAEARMFLPDRYVTGTCHHCDCAGAYGDQCEHCGDTIDPLLLEDPVSTITGTTPEVRATWHWYFQLPHFEDKLAEHLKAHPEWRDQVRNFCLGLLKEGLPERSITRDLDWGVPVPLPDDPDAEGKKLYVWFDAPIGYVTYTADWLESLGKDPADTARWWQAKDSRIVHFIGEDNTVFHAIIWPAMLLGHEGYRLPDNVVANSFINIQFPGDEAEQKISKSRGTAVWIHEYLEQFDPDPLRYYLTAIAPEHARTTFSLDDFVTRNNAELIGKIGNFFNRVFTFAAKHFDARVPEAQPLAPADEAFLAEIGALPAAVGREFANFRFKNALNVTLTGFALANTYLERQAPWKERKTDLARCATTIHVGLQAARTLGTMIAPVLPFAAAKIRAFLGLDDKAWTWERATERLPAGAPLGQPQMLFEKLDPAGDR